MSLKFESCYYLTPAAAKPLSPEVGKGSGCGRRECTLAAGWLPLSFNDRCTSLGLSNGLNRQQTHVVAGEVNHNWEPVPLRCHHRRKQDKHRAQTCLERWLERPGCAAVVGASSGQLDAQGSASDTVRVRVGHDERKAMSSIPGLQKEKRTMVWRH